jgi:hypothetical protein
MSYLPFKLAPAGPLNLAAKRTNYCVYLYTDHLRYKSIMASFHLWFARFHTDRVVDLGIVPMLDVSND